MPLLQRTELLGGGGSELNDPPCCTDLFLLYKLSLVVTFCFVVGEGLNIVLPDIVSRLYYLVIYLFISPF